MTFSNTDSENLARIATALERQADAEERRNDILEREMAQRQVAWEASEARTEAALEQLLRPSWQPQVADPWRDLPEHAPDRPLSERVHPG